MKLDNASLFVTTCRIGSENTTGDELLEVINPATADVIARVPKLGAKEAARAVEAAQQAMPDWAGRTSIERSRLLHALANIIEENQEDLARLLTAEQGKPLAEARGEIGMSAAYVRWFAEEARHQ